MQRPGPTGEVAWSTRLKSCTDWDFKRGLKQGLKSRTDSTCPKRDAKACTCVHMQVCLSMHDHGHTCSSKQNAAFHNWRVTGPLHMHARQIQAEAQDRGRDRGH